MAEPKPWEGLRPAEADGTADRPFEDSRHEMSSFRALAKFLFLIALAAIGAAPARAEFDISKVDPSVIRIQHILKRGNSDSFGPHGSGFVINNEGYAVTNQHVLRPPQLSGGTQHVGIFVPDGGWSKDKLRRVTVIWESTELDLAIIRVDGLKRPAVSISALQHTETPKKGDKVYAVGFPGAADASPGGALSTTLTSGIVGKVFIGRGGRDQTDRPIIQHEAGVSPGNSGGPLFNDCNQVVGVNTFVATSKFIVRREGGHVVARGAAVSGVYYSPHVSSLIVALKARNIPFNSTTKLCTPGGANSTMFVIAAAAVVLLLGGGVLVMVVLRRPRERVVQVVETYSQMLRRKGGDEPAPHRPMATAAMGAVGTVPGQHPMPSAQAAAVAAPTRSGGLAAANGWALSGFDSDGKAVRISVASETLARAARGLVIGRQESLSDLVLEDNTVSRRHARVVELNGGVGIVDLNSSNGTAINGQLLAPYKDPVPLHSGSKIEFGDVKLTFSWT